MAEESPPPGRFDEDEPEPEAPLGFEAPSNVRPIRPMRHGPTAGDPLRGLEHLPQVILFGRERILKLAATPVEYLWQDIAVAGTVVLIAGPPAEGKTTLLFLILAVRLSIGEPVKLLERAIKPARKDQFVVIIEGEHSEASTSRKLKKALTIMGVSDEGLARVFIIARKAVLVGSPEWLELELMVAAGLVSDIAIDTLARVAPADANNEAEQVSIFNRLAATIERAPDGLDRPIVWTVAHTRKNGTDGGLGDVSGSAQRVGQADTVLMVKGEKVDGQTVSSKVTFQKLREDPDDYPKPVEFSIVAGPDKAPQMADVTKPKDTRPLEDRVVDELRIQARTKNWLATKFGRSKTDIEVVVTNLFDMRAITTTDVTVGGRPFKALMLRTDWNSASGPPRDLARDSMGPADEPGLARDEKNDWSTRR